jgi:hypothetical protein
MFIKYEWVDNGFDITTNTVKIGLTVFDTDFVETININTNRYIFEKAVSAIIKLYQSKNLDVAKNLFLLMKRTGSSFETQIFFFRMNVPEYQQYHSQIEKYMLLQ